MRVNNCYLVRDDFSWDECYSFSHFWYLLSSTKVVQLYFLSHDMSSRVYAFKTFSYIPLAKVSHKTEIKIEEERKYIPSFNRGSSVSCGTGVNAGKGKEEKLSMQQIYMQGWYTTIKEISENHFELAWHIRAFNKSSLCLWCRATLTEANLLEKLNSHLVQTHKC